MISNSKQFNWLGTLLSKRTPLKKTEKKRFPTQYLNFEPDSVKNIVKK